MKYPLTLGVLILCVLFSCRTDTCEFSYRTVPLNGWDMSDSMVFPVDSIVADGYYQISVGLRTSAARPYPYRHLSLEVAYSLADSMQVGKHVYNLLLTDSLGDVNGSGISLYQYEHVVDTLHLCSQQSGVITVRHAMRDRVLQGISDVGIRIRSL